MRDLSDEATGQSMTTPILPGFGPLDESPADARTDDVQATVTRLDEDLAAGLRAWADEGRVTVQRLLLAALACVLARYGDCAGEVRISVATESAARVSGRRTIALRPDADMSFADVEHGVHEALLSGADEEGTGTASVGFRTGPTEADPPHSLADGLAYDLCLIDGDNMEFGVRYRADRVGADAVSALLGHIVTVLAAAAVDHGAGRLGRLPLLTAAEEQRMLVEWNDTSVEWDGDACLHELFARIATASPNKPAVIYRDRPHTYGEIDRAANRLANHLRTIGVGRGKRVAVCLDCGPSFLTAIMAVLKAGGAYVPFDPRYPAGRLEYMAENAECCVLISETEFRSAVPNQDIPVVLLDRDAALIAECSSDCPDVDSRPDDLCYVIYTSGSTGLSKGIALRHRGVVNNLMDLRTRFEIGEADRLLALSSISFDMSVFDFIGMTISGGTVIAPATGQAQDPGQWDALITKHSITVWNSAPALLEAYLAYLEAGVTAPRPLRLALLGGDWVAPGTPDRLRKFASDARVIVMGGATEASIHSTLYEAGSPLPGWNSIPYGRPMANQRVYILDSTGAPVPMGIPGELHLAGVGLAEGYLGRPQETADKFFSWSHGSVSERLYRTGDLARFRPDGLVELLGRLDFQVKIRGLRIELGEIEATLRRQPGVRDAVVVVARRAGGEDELVGYVTAVDDQDLDLDLLTSRIAHTLPAHMLPRLVRLAELPLNPNGKVDRGHLSTMPSTSSRDTAHGTEPSTKVERELAEVWRETLGVSRVVLEDKFFDLGGRSLRAMMVASRIRTRLGVEIAPSAVLSGATLAELATAVEAASARGAVSQDAFLPHTTEASGPLSFAQEHAWALEQAAPGTSVGNIALSMTWYADLDQQALRRAMNRLIARHEVLRTMFYEAAGRPWQRVGEPWEIDLEFHDAGDAAPGAGRALDAAVRQASAAPLDLNKGRLLRAHLISDPHGSGGGRNAKACGVLVLVFHQIVCDAWTLSILLRELGIFYQAETEPGAQAGADVRELPSRYLDYVLWQRAQAYDGSMEQDTEYWRDRLTGAPATMRFATARDRRAERTYQGGRYSFTWDRSLRDRLTENSKRGGASLPATLLAGLSVLISRSTGLTDLVVGTPATLRTNPSLEPIAGLFTNTVPIRLDLGGDPGFQELVGRVRDEVDAASAHQKLSFGRLLSELDLVRHEGRTPAVQVMFRFDDVPLRSLRLGGPPVQPRPTDTGSTVFDLAVNFAPAPGGLAGVIEYSVDTFDEVAVRAIANQFRLLMETVARDDSVRLLSSTGERR
ncbi:MULTISPECIES: non-ribosomal peptide synthetase [unclassified Nocardia]|uniref:non-ribosomal peptide synthetase n=1 Tax=unclassified Nocardia TaxID=2637762 RepID=UPI001CE47902|nr:MULTISPECIES: non-ribosomal peptide synthetase [unclassified Nocardia]